MANTYTKVAKDATSFTQEKNQAFAQAFGITQENPENAELQNARRGLLKRFDHVVLQREDGKEAWNSETYQFLQEKMIPDTVHPSLWLNGKANAEAGVFEVVPNAIYQIRGLDLANMTFVRSETGWIVMDVTTCVESASYGLQALEETLGENIHDHIRAILISHSHTDHYGGIKGVVSEEQIGTEPGQIRIYVPAGFDTETVKENVYAGKAMRRRSSYQFGTDLQAGPKGRVSTGLGLGSSNGTVSYIQPTDFITEDTTLWIDGLEVVFQLTPGTEAPAEMNNYFPKYRAFWAAENCTGTLHNLYPIRGAQLRDAANWWRFAVIALEKFGKKADVVFQSHNWPHWNTEEEPHAVEAFLRNQAAVYKYIHDQTLHLANQGETAKEIAREIQLPEALQKVWYTRPYYGAVPFNSRAVYCKYLGFFNGNPTELDPLTEVEEAKLFVEYAGGVDRVVEKAEEDYAAGRYRQAAKAASYAVFADPQHEKARLLNADALEQLGYQSESGIWRNAYLNGAYELRFGLDQATRGTESYGNTDLLQNMTPEMTLDYIGIAADTEKLAQTDVRFRLELTNAAQTPTIYIVHLYHGTVLYYAGDTKEALPYVRIPETKFPYLMTNQYDELQPLIETDRWDIIELLRDVVKDFISNTHRFALITPKA